MRVLPLALTILFLASCASVPRPELSLYQAAYQQADVATKELVRTFAPMEKSVRKPEDEAFRPEYAPYEADEGRPGISELIERGFTAVTQYNAVLLRYAEGETVDTLRPDLTTLSTEATLLTTVVGLPTGAGAAVKPVVDGLLTLTRALLAVSDRLSFARAVERNRGEVSAFLQALRDITPELWSTADSYFQRRQGPLLREGRDAEAAAIDRDKARFRKMLASWVLTLERTDGATKALETAVIEGSPRPLDAANLAFWAGEIRKHAESVKFAARAINEPSD